MTKAVVFDLETTGLPLHADSPLDKQPRIIEYGAAYVEDGVVTDAICNFVYPGELITEEITKITGITNDDLEGCQTFAEHLPLLDAFFAEGDILIAHNLAFDTSILEFELKRLDQTIRWPLERMCTVLEYKDEWGKRPKLTELYEAALGKKLEQTHRALDDVYALCEIVIKEELI